jgi:hypothetical protein
MIAFAVIGFFIFQKLTNQYLQKKGYNVYVYKKLKIQGLFNKLPVISQLIVFWLCLSFGVGAFATITYQTSPPMGTAVNGGTIWLKLNSIDGSTGNFSIGKINGGNFSTTPSTYVLLRNNEIAFSFNNSGGENIINRNVYLGSTLGSATWRVQRYANAAIISVPDSNVNSGQIIIRATEVASPPPVNVPTSPVITPPVPTSPSNGASTPTDDHAGYLEGATVVQPTSSTPGRIETLGDQDYFRINVTSSGSLTVSTTGNTDTYGYLLNSSGQQLDEADDVPSTQRNFSMTQTVTAGTYYVRVKAWQDSSIGDYTFVASFNGTPTPSTSPPTSTDDHAGSLQGATVVQPTSSTRGRIETLGDQDYFRINVTSSGSLTVSTTGNTDIDNAGNKDTCHDTLTKITRYLEI